MRHLIVSGICKGYGSTSVIYKYKNTTVSSPPYFFDNTINYDGFHYTLTQQLETSTFQYLTIEQVQKAVTNHHMRQCYLFMTLIFMTLLFVIGQTLTTEALCRLHRFFLYDLFYGLFFIYFYVWVIYLCYYFTKEYDALISVLIMYYY